MASYNNQIGRFEWVLTHNVSDPCGNLPFHRPHPNGFHESQRFIPLSKVAERNRHFPWKEGRVIFNYLKDGFRHVNVGEQNVAEKHSEGDMFPTPTVRWLVVNE